ncbi:MAG: glycosyltransferase [Clostridia bacterium]|nr:glycosyltransferase [Clostridia bacterium]
MKHIVFVVGNYKNGGVPMHATNLANEFAKQGYCSTILVTKDMAENVFFEHHENVNIVSLKEYVSTHSNDKAVKSNIKKKNKRIRVLKYIRYISKFFSKWDRKLATKIKGLRRSKNLSVFIANNPDCVYIPFGISYFEDVFYASKGTGAKIIYAERNAPEVELPDDIYERNRLIGMLSKADGVVLQTQDELEFYEGRLKKAVVINNPVKENLPEPFKGERRKVVINFCRIAEQKNLPLMINAFMEFHKSHPDYSLEIYGNTVEKIEEDLKSDYLEMISSMNTEEYIKILPPRADIHSVARDCAMFVSSSDFEGLSNSMIEAMAIGLPCVCTDCLGGGAREMITNGENGLLVPMKDTNALALAMCRMADDEALSRKCSENAAKIRETHKVESIASKWLESIEKFI